MAPSRSGSGSRSKKAKHADDNQVEVSPKSAPEVPKSAPALRQPVEPKAASQPVEPKAASKPVEPKAASQAVEPKAASQPAVSQPVETKPVIAIPLKQNVHPDAEKWRSPATFDKWLADEAKKARERLMAANALAESRGSEYKDEDPYRARSAFRWSRMAIRYVEEVRNYTLVKLRRRMAVQEKARQEAEDEERRLALIAFQEKVDAERPPPADLRAVGIVATFGGVMCAAGVPVMIF